ncbi:MAG: hypothetical protein JWP63_1442 [Candidatus Solibacter sp.]|nr:hypothetical protein [Candidatus Solibacter sp.]
MYDGCVINGFPLLQFDRPISRDFVLGFALAWSADLTLVHTLDTAHYLLNGFTIFRNSDVKRWRTIPKDDFFARAARLHRLRPEVPSGVTVASMRDALASVGKAFPLLTIHREQTRRAVCYVGRFKTANQRSVTLTPISPEAEWEEEERYPLRDITLVEFDGAYEKLLHRMAKPTQ